MKNIIIKAKHKLMRILIRSRIVLMNNNGQGMIDVAVVILISVVLGALVLAGLYTLIGSTVLPSLTEKIREMFNYGG